MLVSSRATTVSNASFSVLQHTLSAQEFFTSHLANVPSSIVGESAGILISVGMAVRIP